MKDNNNTILRIVACVMMVGSALALIWRNDLIDTLLIITGVLFLVPLFAEISLWIFTSVRWAKYDATMSVSDMRARSFVIGAVYLTTGLVVGLLMLAVYFLQWAPNGEPMP